jgi:3-phosphoshikimate 1-carboxyvinyltransferase
MKADLSDCIDLLPTMAVLAALSDGRSELNGIERARIKESNRIAAMKEGLDKLEHLGIHVSEERSRLLITGLLTVDPNKKEEEEEANENNGESGEEGEEAQEGEEGQKPKDVPEEPQIAVINSRNDHRIAMAFGTLGAAVGDIIIEDAGCVSKTYPDFWNALKSLGGQLEIDE